MHMTKITDSMKGFHFRIKILYDIEKQLESALPKMAKAATNSELKSGFLSHLEETKEQSKRLEKIFTMIDASPRKHSGAAIRGLISDGKAVATVEAPDALKDALIAGAGRDVEHFEMAGYMNAIEEAKALQLTEAVELLQMTLAEEIVADEKLEAALKEALTLAASEGEGN